MNKYLFEIGTEEIPAGFLPGGRELVRSVTVDRMKDAGLDVSDNLEVYGTPRRLVAVIDDLPASTSDRFEDVKGPPVKAAYDKDGALTKAATGFAAKNGVAAEQLVETNGYLFARRVTPGKPVEMALAEAVIGILNGLSWPKSMKWNAAGARFVRPVRWIISLLNDKIVPIEWGGISAGRETVLRRITDADVRAVISIPAADAYLEILRGEGIIIDQAERGRIVADGIQSIASRRHANAVTMAGDQTWSYLADHVEGPIVIEGEFPAAYAALPREALELTMWRHQKYIPLDSNGSLIPFYAIVANRTFNAGNTVDDSSRAFARNVQVGNHRVLTARLSDAEYFWKDALTRPLIDRLDDLKSVTFQKDAGSTFERVERIEAAALKIACLFDGVTPEDVSRAARLAKADLTTKMVFEFPELQGIVGRRIAEEEGEKEAIALAIERHYWPLGGEAELPSGLSAVIALADKAVLLESIFRAGLGPTGSADPYGLRRAAIGIIRILLAAGDDIAVDQLLESTEVKEFTQGRLINFYIGQGINAAVAEAVAAAGWHSIPDYDRRVRAAAALPTRSDFDDLKTSFKRVMNILKDDNAQPESDSVDPSLLNEPAEQALYSAVLELDRTVTDLLEKRDAEGVVGAMAAMRGNVDRFFDEVMVNAKEPALRANRRAILGHLGRVFLRFMDFSKL